MEGGTLEHWSKDYSPIFRSENNMRGVEIFLGLGLGRVQSPHVLGCLLYF